MGRLRSPFAAILAITATSESVHSFNYERRNPTRKRAAGPACGVLVSHRDTCSIPISARASRRISEEDLFEDDTYYGGKSYGQGRASAVRRKRGSSRDDGGKVNRNFDNDAASADDEIATNTNTLPSTHSSRDFHARAAEAVDILRRNALSVVSEQTWRSEQLDAEKDDLPASSSSPSWRQYQKELQSAVDLVSHSLVERSEESRLVVLGMVAGEHVLLLGPPGTAKSALGRRLSSICGGQFFQRLLTRFTTPEEIFGPLSLRALENDEYRRCTTGFLPTASDGFYRRSRRSFYLFSKGC